MTMLQQLSEVALTHRQRSDISTGDIKSSQLPQILHCLLQLQKNTVQAVQSHSSLLQSLFLTKTLLQFLAVLGSSLLSKSYILHI